MVSCLHLTTLPQGDVTGPNSTISGMRRERLDLWGVRKVDPRARSGSCLLPTMWAGEVQTGYGGPDVTFSQRVPVFSGPSAGNNTAGRGPLAIGARRHVPTQIPAGGDPRRTDGEYQSIGAAAPSSPGSVTGDGAGDRPARPQRSPDSRGLHRLGGAAREAQVRSAHPARSAIHLLHVVHLACPRPRDGGSYVAITERQEASD